MNFTSNMTINDLLPYCIFPNSFIRNSKISPQQKVLFEILCSYDHIQADGTRKGWCDPSLDVIAEQMGLKKRAVQIHLKRLVEAGLVVVIYRNTALTGPRSSVYVLNIIPGLSEADKQRIAATRNIEIRHIISGLNTVKVQTAKGMQYVSEEEFDLEYLVTGKRSLEPTEHSVIIDGEIADPESIISKQEEKKVSQDELHGINNDNIDISFKPLTKRNNTNNGYNSVDINERIKAGNYTGVSAKEVCQYFKYLYEKKYKGEIYVYNQRSEVPLMRNQIDLHGLDVVIAMVECLIDKYEVLFYNSEYPRPQLYQFRLPWVINKLSTAMAMDAQPTVAYTSEVKHNKESKKSVII